MSVMDRTRRISAEVRLAPDRIQIVSAHDVFAAYVAKHYTPHLAAVISLPGWLDALYAPGLPERSEATRELRVSLALSTNEHTRRAREEQAARQADKRFEAVFDALQDYVEQVSIDVLLRRRYDAAVVTLDREYADALLAWALFYYGEARYVPTAILNRMRGTYAALAMHTDGTGELLIVL